MIRYLHQSTAANHAVVWKVIPPFAVILLKIEKLLSIFQGAHFFTLLSFDKEHVRSTCAIVLLKMKDWLNVLAPSDCNQIHFILKIAPHLHMWESVAGKRFEMVCFLNGKWTFTCTP